MPFIGVTAEIVQLDVSLFVRARRSWLFAVAYAQLKRQFPFPLGYGWVAR